MSKTNQPERLLYLSDRDLLRLAPTPASVRQALAEAFLAAAKGEARTLPKCTLPLDAGHFFQAMPAALAGDTGLAAVKWVGVAAENAARGLPNISALIVLNDLETARPRAILAGERITAWRTAAMTALAAQYLARPDSRSLALIGAGVQAQSHLAALHDLFPDLAEVCIFGRGRPVQEALAAAAKDRGLKARLVETPAEALNDADLVVSSVRMAPDLEPFLDARMLKPGAFASLVDLGHSWIKESFAAFDRMATDEHAQSRTLAAQGKLRHPGPWDADLAELVSGAAQGRTGPEQRCGFAFAGLGLADLATAAALVEAAGKGGIGTWLET